MPLPLDLETRNFFDLSDEPILNVNIFLTQLEKGPADLESISGAIF